MMTCIGGQWDTLGDVRGHDPRDRPHVVSDDGGLGREAVRLDGRGTHPVRPVAVAWTISSRASTTRRGTGRTTSISRRPADEVELMHHGDRFPNYNAYGVARLLQAGHGAGGAPRRARAAICSTRRSRNTAAAGGTGTLRPTTSSTRSRMSRAGPVLVLADLVLRDLAAGPGHRHGHRRGRLAGGRDREPGQGADAGTPGGHPGGRPAESLEVPVDVWLGGAKRTTVRVAKAPAVKSVEIDPAQEFPDIDRDNQRWPR